MPASHLHNKKKEREEGKHVAALLASFQAQLRDVFILLAWRANGCSEAAQQAAATMLLCPPSESTTAITKQQKDREAFGFYSCRADKGSAMERGWHVRCHRASPNLPDV